MIRILSVTVAGIYALCSNQADARGVIRVTPYDQCFSSVGRHFGIHPLLLKAIARQESGMNPAAFNRNKDGSYDVGLMQINSQHFRAGKQLHRAGVTEERLRNEPCTNIAVGGWLLADAIRRNGMSWKAVGVYHSPTPWRQKDYAAKIAKKLVAEIRTGEAVQSRNPG
jgi:soluble lytic murein transglycosylase-like protein